ncbi:hypothetical protein GCM10010170_073490 [Dactylosporangium salmoneum]|uniref:Uncharacterized protein n=1 Tax=Dactylosporangium salmoneum TaxID=53361 RepID=A0ABP5U7E6_9ACTN
MLRTSTTASGHLRVLAVTQGDGRFGFAETYSARTPSGQDTGWMGRFAAFRVEARDGEDPAPLIEAVADLAGRGRLDLPPMQARELVADLLVAAGVLVRRSSTVPWAHVGGRATVVLEPDGRPPAIRFTEHHGDAGRRQVEAGFEDLDRIAAYLAARHPRSVDGVGEGDRIGRFLGAFTAFAAEHEGRVEAAARLYTELGVEHEERFEWRYRLLHANRTGTGCLFSLTLLVSSIENRIAFTEFYDYEARGADAGREYGYSAVTPYDSIGRLLGHLEPRLGRAHDGPPAERLARCFEGLLATGVLGDGRAIETNRDAVLGLFTEAGVPGEPDFWFWAND